MKYVGLDIGTTLIKGQLIDSEGIILSTAEFDSPTYSKNGISYLNAKEVKNIVFKLIQKITTNTTNEVKGICVSSLGEAFVLIDKEGNPLNDFILFVSNLGEEECEQIKEKIEVNKIAAITGLYPNRMFSFSKLMYLKKHSLSLLNNADKLLMVAPYVTYLLTGDATCDYSLASRSMLFDIKNKTWSKELINACGLKQSIFPPLYKCDEIIGTIKPDLADELNLSINCQVLASGHDQLMAALGSGLIKKGMANDGTGTAECLAVLFDKIPTNMSFYKNNFCVVPYVFDNTYITYAFNNTGGALLKWHKEKLSPLENSKYKEENKNYFDVLNNTHIKLPTDLFVLPYFDGSGTPYLDGSAQGAILGLNQNTSKEEIYFALMEGATFEIKLNMELLKKEGIDIKEISSTGGGSNSSIWLQIKSNIYNKKIKTLSSNEGGIFGCYLLLKHALEKVSYETLIEQKVKIKEVIKPQKDVVQLYKSKYKDYKRIYPSIKRIARRKE